MCYCSANTRVFSRSMGIVSLHLKLILPVAKLSPSNHRNEPITPKSCQSFLASKNDQPLQGSCPLYESNQSFTPNARVVFPLTNVPFWGNSLSPLFYKTNGIEVVSPVSISIGESLFCSRLCV